MFSASSLLTFRPVLLLSLLALLGTSVLQAEESTEDAPPVAEDSAATTVDSTTTETADPDSEESAPPPAPVIPRHNPDPVSNRHFGVETYLKQHQRRHEVITLISAERSFYGLFLPDRSGSPQGGLVILHDLEQHGQWPVLVGPLREQLPEYGWSTLAIELPDPYSVRTDTPETAEPAQEVPAQPETEPEFPAASGEELLTEEDNGDGPSAGSSPPQPETDPDNEPPLPRLEALPPLPAEQASVETVVNTPVPAYDVIMQERILTGLMYLYDRGQMNLVLIAAGDTAPVAANAIAAWQRDRGEEKGIALIMIDARENPALQLPLDELLKPLDIRILDLITRDNRMTQWQLNNRRGMMKRQHNDNYMQIVLNGAGADDPATVRRVRGWLRQYAAGTELP